MRKFKLKLSKRPVRPAHWFGKEIATVANGLPDLFGMSIAYTMGTWSLYRQHSISQPKRTKHFRRGMKAALGCAIAAIIYVAYKHKVSVTFNTMDSFIRVERKSKPKIDYALGLFHSAFSKWCISVTCFAEPDMGVTQQMLQLMLNAVGLMAYLTEHDPVVDCFMPVFDQIVK